MQDLNLQINKKIASAALCYHLDSCDNANEVIAISALAIYLNTYCGNTKRNIIAQAALALYLQNNPDASFSAPNNIVNFTSNNSSWGNKILMMRQLPIRK
jgi:hypothetical protein